MQIDIIFLESATWKPNNTFSPSADKSSLYIFFVELSTSSSFWVSLSSSLGVEPVSSCLAGSFPSGIVLLLSISSVFSIQLKSVGISDSFLSLHPVKSMHINSNSIINLVDFFIIFINNFLFIK